MSLRLTRQPAARSSRSLELLETAASLLAAPVSPGTRGALYRLIATLPGLRYDGEVRDALGRLGAAVSIGRAHDGAAITFDPATGELLSVAPHAGAALTVFHVVQSTRNALAEDTLQGPTAASCRAELLPPPSPQLSGGARTSVAIGGLRGLARSHSFGPASIGRSAWCPGQYQLQVTSVDGRQRPPTST